VLLAAAAIIAARFSPCLGRSERSDCGGLDDTAPFEPGGNAGAGFSRPPRWPMEPHRAVGNSLTCWLFALFCIVARMRLYLRVPQAKGQSLEQIRQLWKEPT